LKQNIRRNKADSSELNWVRSAIEWTLKHSQNKWFLLRKRSISDSNIIYSFIFSTLLLSTNVFWAYTNNVDLESLVILIAMSVLNHIEQLCNDFLWHIYHYYPASKNSNDFRMHYKQDAPAYTNKGWYWLVRARLA